MMTNLFSSFDPQTFPYLSMNWLISPMSLMMLPKKFWNTSNNNSMMMNMMKLMLVKEMKPIILNNMNKGMMIIPISLMTMMALQNLLGLLPFTFTNPAHISMTLSLVLPMWMTLMTFGWIMKTNHMFTHLLPPSSPYPLIPFMIMIETTSNMIRPITLSVRLTANLTAGHLIITLTENTMMLSTSAPNLLMMMMIQVTLFILETTVAVIQAYVISILMMLYVKEIN